MGHLGLRLADGTLQWHAPYAIPDNHFPVRDGRALVLTEQFQMIALDENTGARIYDHNCYPDLRDAASPRCGSVYKNRVAFPCATGHLAIFDADDGSLIDVREERAKLWASTVVDGKLAVGTGNGALLVYDESIWQL
jgi:outer membrane protein assembly factor BamB